METAEKKPEESMPKPEADEKIIAAISYLAFFFVIPFIVKPKSKFCTFHGKQSFLLFLSFIVVLMFMVASRLIGSVLTLGIFALYILALYRSFVGDYWKIPVLGAIAEKLNVESLYTKAGISAESLQALKEKAMGAAANVAKNVEKLASNEPPSEQKTEEKKSDESSKQ